MKLQKKLGAVILTLLMVAACCVPTFAAGKQFKTYVVLGDSIAAGYMLDGYKFGGRKHAAWTVTKNSYPDHVAKAVGATKTYQMAHGGYRTSDLRVLLDDSYKGDFINGRRLPSIGDTLELDRDAVAKLKKDFRNNIAKADLITLNVGSNDSTQAFAVLLELAQDDISVLEAQRRLGTEPLADFGRTIANVIQLTTNNVYKARLAKLELESFEGFRKNFDAIVKAIRELNSHAKLVVVGVYNPIEIWSLDALGILQYGQLVNPVVDYFNNYMRYTSKYKNEYTFAPMRNIETYVGIGEFEANEDILMDAHPTVKGHKQMADQIVAVL